MRIYAVFAALYRFAVLFRKSVCTRTIHVIKRAIAEQTVDVFAALVARIIFTVLIRKKSR